MPAGAARPCVGLLVGRLVHPNSPLAPEQGRMLVLRALYQDCRGRKRRTRLPGHSNTLQMQSQGLYICIIQFRSSSMALSLRPLALVVLLLLPAGAGMAQDTRRRPVLARPDHAVLCAGREAGQPAVVNVYAARVVENRNPLLDDPIFRRFFGGPGQPREQMQRSLGSGVMVDPVRPGRHQQPRHRGRRPGQDFARRQARVRGRDRAQGQPHRSRGAAHQGRARTFPDARFRQFRRTAGRRRRARRSAIRSASARP